MTDDALTDAWLAGEVFPRGITHDEHLRIAWVLHRRHGPATAEALLLSGTQRACAVHGVPEKFDPVLTRRWSRAVADAIRHGGLRTSATSFIAAHPDLQRGDRPPEGV